jgi:hypothetical protein
MQIQIDIKTTQIRNIERIPSGCLAEDRTGKFAAGRSADFLSLLISRSRVLIPAYTVTTIPKFNTITMNVRCVGTIPWTRLVRTGSRLLLTMPPAQQLLLLVHHLLLTAAASRIQLAALPHVQAGQPGHGPLRHIRRPLGTTSDTTTPRCCRAPPVEMVVVMAVGSGQGLAAAAVGAVGVAGPAQAARADVSLGGVCRGGQC